MAPGPAAGTDARALLIPWYAEKPTVLCEEYLILEDGECIDLNAIVGSALTLKRAAEKAQRWVAEHDRPVIIVHESSVRVATVGKEIPEC